MTKVEFIPAGYRNVTPYLYVRNAARAIDFYKDVFGATERMRMPGPNGRIMHAELEIGDSIIMLADENPAAGVKSPETVGEASTGLHIYVEDVDSTTAQAVDEGAKLIRAVEDQFYGDRTGTIVDPFGHRWSISTHIEDVTPEEMKKRMAKLTSQAAAG